MLLNAKETWKIDWKENVAFAEVKNETMRTFVGVDEYCQIIQMGDSAKKEKEKEKETEGKEKGDVTMKCAFIKRLYVHPLMNAAPQFVLDALSSKYKEESDTQMRVIAELCERPLKKVEL